MKAIVIVEAISTALFYEQDILDRGYLPIVIYPHIEGSKEDKAVYEGIRAASRRQLSGRTVEIPDDGDFDHLLAALAPYEIACVVAGSEMGVVLADRLAQALGLFGNPPASSLLHQNKDMMQEALRKRGIRSIRGKVVHNSEEVESWWKELNVPHVVIKPVAGAGTGGLHFCNSLEETLAAANEEFSKTDYFGRREGALIMQERIEGTEYIVNTVSRNGVHRVTDIWVYDKVRRGQSGNAYNYARSLNKLEAGHQELVEYAYQVLDALDFQYGPSHGEYMLTETGPVLIEVGARPMGGHFPKALLARLLGHHLTDVSLDSYLDPEAFEQARKRPYRTNGFLMNKFFITPRGGAVDSYPILTILGCLKTMAGGSLAPAFADFMLPTTVDLDTAPGNILLYSQDENAVWRDYQILRTIELKCFSALFEVNPRPEEYPKESSPVPPLKGLDGTVYVLVDERPEERIFADGRSKERISAAGRPEEGVFADERSGESACGRVRYLTPEDLAAVKQPGDAGIFMMRGKYSLEERAGFLRMLVRLLKSGAPIRIPEEVYRFCSIGRTGLESLLEAFGVTLEVPEYGSGHGIVGSAAGDGERNPEHG